jgi:hypothetical protein
MTPYSTHAAPVMLTDLDLDTIKSRLSAARDIMRDVAESLARQAEDARPVELYEIHAELTSLENELRKAEGLTYKAPGRAHNHLEAAVKHHATACQLITRLAEGVKRQETRDMLASMAEWDGDE